MGLMRIPYTDPLPAPRIIPATASTFGGAVAALSEFLSGGESVGKWRGRATSPLKQDDRHGQHSKEGKKTVLLTGAGISVASGLADYRGENGTYTLNKSYRPIYYHEFVASHEARKRYWARSFLGWPNLERAKPNAAHRAVKRLGELNILSSVITQNVDSFHPKEHPQLPTIELHGYLRSLVCLTCRTEYPRTKFQNELSRLNQPWDKFLQEMLASGALTTEDPEERRAKGLRTNPDGDVDIQGVDYTTFRYPPCPTCFADLQRGKLKPLANGDKPTINLDADGAWLPTSNAGILKPAVIMFGESIPNIVKSASESAIDQAERILVVGSSLATYSAWRLVKRAKDRGMRLGMLNLGGIRGEEGFFGGLPSSNTGSLGMRCSQKADILLPEVVKVLANAQHQVTDSAGT